MTWKDRADRKVARVNSELRKYGLKRWWLCDETPRKLIYEHPEADKGIHQWWVFTKEKDWVE